MSRATRCRYGFFLAAVLIALLILSAAVTTVRAQKSDPPTPGSLQILGHDGQPGAFCPLKHTDVQAEVSGPIARVTVTQEFANTSNDKIEAVYVFPLPQNAAVDDMTMLVGDRTIRGVIKEREEARKIYEQARQQGHVAALLDQERPNIFTQSVTNILPGASVKITISYVELLKYEEGHYEFMFPMVVGPRYIPGNQVIGKQGGGWAPDTDKVPDASRITPPVAKPGTRAGHDISLAVTIDAGVPIQNLKSTQHKVDIDRTGASGAIVRLANQAEIPNRDFVFRYDVAGPQLADAVLTHRDGNGFGYFSLILQPPERFPESDVTPKEVVFVLDTSGSMSGYPIEKGKQLVSKMLTHLYPKDTFNLITFSGDTSILFPEPVYPTVANLTRAQQFLDSRQGGGGTEMMKAIRAALEPSDAADHIRIVCFITDGYVGNDMEIIGEIKKHPNARVFSFGIGSSVNRFLLDKMSEAGRGEVEYVNLQQDAAPAVDRLFERMRSPLLTDISIDWNGLPVAEVYPQQILDVFAAKPVVIYGAYARPATGTIILRGKRAGAPYEREIHVTLPKLEKRHDVLSTLWARQKIDHLMSQDWTGMQNGQPTGNLKQQITALGLQHRLMTQFTSFVAVEDRVVTDGGQPRTIQVPVELPQGVRYEGIFGERKDAVGGYAGGVVGGIVTSKLASVPMSRSYSVNQTVEVTASSPMIDTTQSSISTTISGYPMMPLRSLSELGTLYDQHAPKESKSKRALLEQKSDTATIAVWECSWLNAAKMQLPKGCDKLPRDKVRVELTVSQQTPQLLEQLRKLGFVRDTQGNAIGGTVPIEKLAQIASLPEVKFIRFAPSLARK